MAFHSIIQTCSQSHVCPLSPEVNPYMPGGSLRLSAENDEFLSFSLCPCTAHRPIDDCTTPTPSCHYPTAGLSRGPPGGLPDPNDDPNDDLPNLFNDDESPPPSLPSPCSIPLPDLLLSYDPSPSIPDDDINLVPALTWAIHDLAKANKSDRDTSSVCTKVCKPDTFDGSNPCKLCTFLVQCELNFQDRPKAFQTDHTKVIFVQSYLKGIALEWFEPDLLNSNPTFRPLWMNDPAVFIDDLKANFGLHDPVGDAEHQLDHLSMKDGQRINQYVIEFNHLASQVHGYGPGTLHHIFYNRMPDRIKDEISYIGKPAMLQSLHMLAQTIDAQYWECKSEITRQVKPVSSFSASSTSNSASLTTSTSSAPNSASSNSHIKKSTPSSSTSVRSAAPAPPTHLGKDGKLTEEEHQRHFKEKLCIFCGQPGHMAKDCPKSSSKASKARVSMVAPATSAPVPSELEN